MEKGTMAKLIAVGMIIMIGMSMGCIGDATVEDIKESPDCFEKEVIIDSVSDNSSPVKILGTTEIRDIVLNSNHSGKEVTIEGILGRGSLPNRPAKNPGFPVSEPKAPKGESYRVDIYAKYDGELPIDKWPATTKTNSFGAVSVISPGTPTKIKVTGIVENGYHGSTWMPCIKATSWEYV